MSTPVACISAMSYGQVSEKGAFCIGDTNGMVDRGLMDKNNMDNLGFADLKDKDKNNDPNKK